ncbi:hypothetical protein [Phenylobacterium sp.]|uniref:hypothetical protein n=1 Tax=Phenylobacterium sp. TaxID=1871053 RepID=UPI0034516197
MKGRTRCRMHGGAAGSGAPSGERNGSWRGGLHAQEMRALRRLVSEVLDPSWNLTEGSSD